MQPVSGSDNYGVPKMPTVEDSRFRVERAAVFEDSLAYNNRRGIYILTDKKTERTYIGISGVGVTEMYSYTTTTSCGNNCVTTQTHEAEQP